MGNAAGILECSEDELVSSDLTGNPASSIFSWARARIEGRQVKVVAWYDNKWGVSNRVIDTPSDLLPLVDRNLGVAADAGAADSAPVQVSGANARLAYVLSQRWPADRPQHAATCAPTRCAYGSVRLALV